MRAALVESFDAPPRYAEVPEPVSVAPYEEVVEVLAAALHPAIDVWIDAVPEDKTVITADSYLIAVADSAAFNAWRDDCRYWRSTWGCGIELLFESWQWNFNSHIAWQWASI